MPAGVQRRFISKASTVKIALGSQIHLTSDRRTLNPLSEKNAVMPIGDTAIGLQGKKYRV
jgi:hypothetical protein